MKKPTKKQLQTFKCQECKNIFPKWKIISNYIEVKKLIDNRKFWHKKIVCKRCYNRFYYNRKLNAGRPWEKTNAI